MLGVRSPAPQVHMSSVRTLISNLPPMAVQQPAARCHRCRCVGEFNQAALSAEEDGLTHWKAPELPLNGPGGEIQHSGVQQHFLKLLNLKMAPRDFEFSAGRRLDSGSCRAEQVNPNVVEYCCRDVLGCTSYSTELRKHLFGINHLKNLTAISLICFSIKFR